MNLPRMSDAKWLNASIHWADLSAESFCANGMLRDRGEDAYRFPNRCSQYSSPRRSWAMAMISNVSGSDGSRR